MAAMAENTVSLSRKWMVLPILQLASAKHKTIIWQIHTSVGGSEGQVFCFVSPIIRYIIRKSERGKECRLSGGIISTDEHSFIGICKLQREDGKLLRPQLKHTQYF